MTTTDHKKVLNQIANKPGKVKKYLKNSTPRERKFGRSTKKCARCGRMGGHIDKYELGLCRQCFRENALALGFKQYR